MRIRDWSSDVCSSDLGRPFVERAVLNLPGGKHFTVHADNLSAANAYVGRVLLNGKPLAKGYVTDAQIRAGGELRFVMQATPNQAWATAVADRRSEGRRGGKEWVRKGRHRWSPGH